MPELSPEDIRRLERMDTNMEWMKEQLFGNGSPGYIQNTKQWMEDHDKSDNEKFETIQTKLASWDGVLKFLGWIGLAFGGTLLLVVIELAHHLISKAQ